MTKSRPPCSRSPGRRGYTLLEMVVSAGAATLLLLGLASSLVIGSRAFDGTGRTAQQARAAEVQADLLADLNHATSFTSRGSSAVTFTVPDRDNDGREETLSYAHTGTQLTYAHNGSPPAVLLDDVRDFQLTYLDRTLAGTPYTPPALDPAQWGERWRTGPLTFGYETVFPDAYTDNAQWATKVTLSESGILTDIVAYMDADDSKIRFGLYSDQSGSPGALIVETDTYRGQREGPRWHTLSVAPTTLAAGTYWLALAHEQANGPRFYYELGTGETHKRNHNAAKRGFLSNWGNSTAVYPGRISIYGIYLRP